ncbi:MAG: FAD-dependent oxidoreductase [Proteobacteria bacterium]|nr:FAD-dependent oxidoreductase [Pseudomonadota bacterium]
MNKKIVIIGGVAAGPKTASRLKRLMPNADITIIDQDNLISYGGCGIPYFVSGDVTDEKELRTTSFHVVRDEDFFENAKGVKALTSTRALSIDRKAKTVHIENVITSEKSTLAYDKLVLATGSKPNVIPIPGADLDGIFTVNNMHKAMAIKERLTKGKVGRAVIIGGGFIGVEMAEAFGDLWGIETTIIEFMPQLLPRIVDPVFAGMLTHHLEKNGVTVHTNESAQKLEADENGKVARVVTDKRTLETDIVIMAVGVRPRSELALDAGLLVSPQGAIVVNNRLQTSDPNIYAAGDCIETTHLVSGSKSYAPLGSLANRQGRVVADNIAGNHKTFNGIVGSFIMKAFECCIGATGLSLEIALAEGFDAASVITAQSDRAHFFPTQAVIPLMMVFDRSNGRVLGLQGFGPASDAVLARIDAAAGLIAKGATVDDFSILDLAYSPPFSTALDALNATGNVAENYIAGRLRTVGVAHFDHWMNNPESESEWVALDIRHPKEAGEFAALYGGRWIAMPYVEVRKRFQELPEDKTLIIICDAGTRSYEIQCFLDSTGRVGSLVLGGGFNIFRRLGPVWWPGSEN